MGCAISVLTLMDAYWGSHGLLITLSRRRQGTGGLGLDLLEYKDLVVI